MDTLSKVVAKPCPWWEGAAATVYDSLAHTIFTSVHNEHAKAALEAEGHLGRHFVAHLSVTAMRASGMPVPADVAARAPELTALVQRAAAVEELWVNCQALGSLAISMVCNNPGCTNSSGPTELKLVKGSSKTCSGCQVARYCSRGCQEQHWKQHKATCKRLKAATAQTAF